MATVSTKSQQRSPSSRSRNAFAQVEEVLRCIPGYDPFANPGDAWLDHDAAIRAINFFPDRLKHVEGSTRGTPFILKRWQAAIVGNIFGWKRRDDAGRTVRRYRKVLIYVPRGNGKTPLAAGIVLESFFEDGEPGAQCYLAAGQREQAGILFRNAKGMVEQEPSLKDRVTIYGGDQHRSLVLADDPLSFCKVIPADAAGQHGGIPHISVVDELHVQQNRDLLDVFETGMSKKVRSQPLLVMITTADFDRESICNEMHDYASKVRDGTIDDPEFLPVIYEASAEDDWTDERTWEKSNPNIDVSVSRESLRKACKKAQELASFENTFLRLHLNIKTQSDVKWIRFEQWDACNDAVDDDELIGRECFAGVDLSSKVDITALVLVFPPTAEDPLWRIRPKFWVPEKNAHLRERRDKVAYLTWSKQGLIELIPGDTIDQAYVEEEIRRCSKAFDVRQIGFDEWNASQFAVRMSAEGAPMIAYGQGYRSMSEPTKLIEALIVDKKIAHGGNPVLRWMVGNTNIETDQAGNIKPSKKKSTGRIDGVVGAVMGVGLAIAAPAHNPAAYAVRSTSDNPEPVTAMDVPSAFEMGDDD